jgi:hypothetical protein
MEMQGPQEKESSEKERAGRTPQLELQRCPGRNSILASGSNWQLAQIKGAWGMVGSRQRGFGLVLGGQGLCFPKGYIS